MNVLFPKKAKEANIKAACKAVERNIEGHIAYYTPGDVRRYATRLVKIAKNVGTVFFSAGNNLSIAVPDDAYEHYKPWFDYLDTKPRYNKFVEIIPKSDIEHEQDEDWHGGYVRFRCDRSNKDVKYVDMRDVPKWINGKFNPAYKSAKPVKRRRRTHEEMMDAQNFRGDNGKYTDDEGEEK